jgi:hypothetical protein
VCYYRNISRERASSHSRLMSELDAIAVCAVAGITSRVSGTNGVVLVVGAVVGAVGAGVGLVVGAVVLVGAEADAGGLRCGAGPRTFLGRR